MEVRACVAHICVCVCGRCTVEGLPPFLRVSCPVASVLSHSCVCVCVRVWVCELCSLMPWRLLDLNRKKRKENNSRVALDASWWCLCACV